MNARKGPHKKILVLSTNPFGYDGISNVILNYHGSICNKALQFHIAISRISASEKIEEIKNVFEDIHILPDRKKETAQYLISLYRLLKKQRFDIIHLHGNSSTMIIDLLVALLSRVNIRIAHSHNSTSNSPLIHKLFRPILNKLTSFNFACSRCAGDWLFNGKYYILNNGIDTKKFSYNKHFREKHRSALNLEDKIVIGHVGHFTHQKNHEFIIEMFKKLCEDAFSYHLLLVGEGPALERIKQKITEYNLQSDVTLFEKRDDVNELLSAMDIFILPSRFEGLPLSGIEAQASGVPVFVSDKVTSELNLTGCVRFLPISDASVWVKSIMECQATSRIEASLRNVKILKDKGYDVASNARTLMKNYITMRPV